MTLSTSHPAPTNPVVGREAEIARLVAALEQMQDGFGKIITLQGRPGAGKTRLARWLTPYANERGYRVAWAVCGHSESAPPFWPWSQALRSLLSHREGGPLPPHLAPLVELVPELDLLPVTQPENSKHARFMLFVAVVDLLRDLADDGPIVVIFDDIQIADMDSLHLLLHVAENVFSIPILIVATWRTTGSTSSPERATLMERLAVASEEIVIAALSRDDVASFIGAFTGSDADPALATRIHELTAGNAFFMDRIVRAVVSNGGQLDGAAPAGVQALIAQRLRALGPDAQELMAALAVVERPATPLLAASICGRSVEVAFSVFDEAERDGLLATFPGVAGHYVFHHPLVMSAVYDSLAPMERARLHASAAEEIGRESDDRTLTAQIARHWELASVLGEAQRTKAFEYARRAGDQAMRAAAWEAAVDWYTRARRLERAADEQVGLRVALGRAEMAAGQTTAARETFGHAAQAARERGTPESLAHAALGFAQTGEGGVTDPEKVSLLREAAAALPPDERKLRSLVLSRAARVLWQDPSSRRLRERLRDSALNAAREANDDATLITVLDSTLSSNAGPDGLEERLAAVRELDQLTDVLQPELEICVRRWRLNTLLQTGRTAEAVDEVAGYERAALETRLPQFAYNAALRRCFHPFLGGRIEEASRLIDEARDEGRRAGDIHAEAAWCAGRSAVALYSEVAEARRRLPELEHHVQRLTALPLYRSLLVCLRLRAGDRAGALEVLEPLTSQAFASIPSNMFTLASYALLSRAVLALDDRPCAQKLLELQLPYVDQAACIGAYLPMGAVAFHAGRLAVFLGDPRADDLVRRGHALNKAMDARLWLDAESSFPRIGDLLRDDERGDSVSRASLTRESRGFWKLTVDGRVRRFKTTKGIGYLATLLARPDKEWAAVDMAGVAPELQYEGSGPLLDDEAKAAYRVRIATLRSELEVAGQRQDPGRADEVRTELDFLLTEIRRAVGRRGRDRVQNSTVERARSSVTRALRRAIEKVSEVEPDFAKHLDMSVQTGRCCSYTSSRHVEIRVGDEDT